MYTQYNTDKSKEYVHCAKRERKQSRTTTDNYSSH